MKGFAAAELSSEHPERLAARWSEVLGLPVSGNEIRLDEGVLRFVAAEDVRKNWRRFDLDSLGDTVGV